HQHVGDENAAVRAALSRDPRSAGDAAADEIGGNSGEIVMRARLAGAPAGLVPTAAELAAAPQVRDDARSAAFEPELSDGRVVAGKHRDVESAIAGEMHGRVAGLSLGANLHVGNSLPANRTPPLPAHPHSTAPKRPRPPLP